MVVGCCDNVVVMVGSFVTAVEVMARDGIIVSGGAGLIEYELEGTQVGEKEGNDFGQEVTKEDCCRVGSVLG